VTDRARIPFALIGVLLLVSSGTVAVSEQEPLAGEPAVDEAMDGLAAETQTAIRSAVRAAARAAAREPVLVRGNSTVGSQLATDRPFVDALRLRIYLRTQDYLARLDDRRRGLDVSASLPPIDGEGDVPRAIDRVTLSRAGPAGSRLRVDLEGLRLRARSDGRRVGRAIRSPSLVVRTPVLAVHDRVQRFESRLNADLTRPGLSRRLSAGLYPVAWARGYAQFAGQPIENVVANRHVAIVANGAVLALQRRTFGSADARGRRVYRRTVRDAAVNALVGASNSSALRSLKHLRGAVDRDSADEPVDRLAPPADVIGPGTPMTVGIDRAADLAYRQSIAALNDTLDRTYSPEIRVRADVTRIDRRASGGHRPASARSRVDSFTVTRTNVENRSGTPPAPAPGWHRLLGDSRTVTVTERTVTTWALPGNASTTTSETERRTYAVDLLVAGNHDVGPAPAGRIERVHEPGGPFDGPNLVDVEALAREHVRSRGGIDALSSRAARGALDTGAHRVQATRPDGLARWARPAVTRLHRRVRNLSVSIDRGRVATFQANVPALLADRLRDRREALLDAPDPYGSVAVRARAGVRADYLDRVLDRLDAAAAQHRRGRGNLSAVLPGTTAAPAELLANGWPAGGPSDRAGAPPVRLSVDGAPSYLTLEPVDREAVSVLPRNRTEHPLVARNLNAVSVPTDGAVEALFGLLDGPEKTSLRSAARVLAVAGEAGVATRSGPGNGLHRDVTSGAWWLEQSVKRVLARHGLGPGTARNRTVERALDRWETPAARAAALANGSAAAAVHAEAIDRWPDALESQLDRELLAIDLESAALRARSVDAFQPREAVVQRAATSIRRALGTAGREGSDRLQSLAADRAAEIAARLPGGVPVLPAPGFWYAMVNAWHVQVRGSYVRFVVSVPRGAPDRLPADLRYVRENRRVRLDVDGDGTGELLGRNRRITFGAETVVGVAVPPKPRGVGDVGERDERSPGWPTPGPVDRGNAK